MRDVIIVSGALANKVGNGGGAWERLSWAAGLKRLGYDVYFVEQIAAATCRGAGGDAVDFELSSNVEWFRSVTKWFGFEDRSVLVCADGSKCVGLTWDRLLDIAASAALLVNLSGHLTLSRILERVARKAYIDVDPGFTQIWHADPSAAFRVGGHDFYFTIGENIGSADCPIPTGDVLWRPIRQPVVLADWPVSGVDGDADIGRFTTIASWRGAFGSVTFGGRTLGVKAHEFRKFFSLPRLARPVGGAKPSFEIALDIHSGDAKDLAALEENGWRIMDPRIAAGGPQAFRQYVQGSGAEFSVAQGIYVDTNSGWFSDRTVRYLASGKPALVQETGFSRHLTTGEGLVPFRTFDDAVEGAERIVRDYDSHCRAARAVAEKYFDSDVVLKRFLLEVGVKVQ